MAKLATHVHVLNPKTGAYEVFGPSDDLPTWAQKELKDKEHVWADEKSDRQAETTAPETAKVDG